MVRFCPVASGSSGNCLYVGTQSTSILIDAGLSGKKIEEGLKGIGILPESLEAIFVTHEHLDHIKGVGVLSRRHDVAIYATEGTWQAMEAGIGAISRKNKKIIYIDEKMKLNDITIEPFAIPHDAAQPVGYSVYSGDIKVTTATDVGHITQRVKEAIAESKVLLLEANHDVDMVKNGAYPYSLKKRILGDLGHLSNEKAGELLSEIITEKLQHVFLGHLSMENNLPSLAYNTVLEMLFRNEAKKGKDFCMEMASRHSVSTVVQI